jgi:hypothetical protein
MGTRWSLCVDGAEWTGLDYGLKSWINRTQSADV